MFWFQTLIENQDWTIIIHKTNSPTSLVVSVAEIKKFANIFALNKNIKVTVIDQLLYDIQ